MTVSLEVRVLDCGNEMELVTDDTFDCVSVSTFVELRDVDAKTVAETLDVTVWDLDAVSVVETERLNDMVNVGLPLLVKDRS